MKKLNASVATCLFALLVSPAIADCYRCTISDLSHQLECRAIFSTGGDACLVAPSSCWTNDKCKCDEKEDNAFDARGIRTGDGDCDEDPGPQRPQLDTESYRLSEEGSKILSSRDGLVGTILHDMLSLTPRRLPLGGIRSGLVKHDGRFWAFKGRLKVVGESLAISFTFPDHPLTRKVEMTVSNRGERIVAKVTDAAGAVREVGALDLP